MSGAREYGRKERPVSRGEALLETALVLPLLLLLAFGVVGAGRVTQARLGVSAASREAARATVGRGTSGPDASGVAKQPAATASPTGRSRCWSTVAASRRAAGRSRWRATRLASAISPCSAGRA